MARMTKIAVLVLAIASIWFSFSLRGGNIFLKVGTWERTIYKGQAVLCTPEQAVYVAEASEDDSGDTDFA